MKRIERTVEERGRRRTVAEKPDTEPMVWPLSHLTVTGIIEKGVRRRPFYSNWDPISEGIFANIGAKGPFWSPVGA